MAFVIEEGMRLPTVLAAVALIVGLMQGVLGLESTAPARVSLRKAHMLLCMEFFEISIVLASEAVSFAELRKALKVRMDWLEWLAPAILALGICELIIDVFFTFRSLTFSRALWVPLSAFGGSNDWAEIVEILCLLATCSLSIVLVGWRQNFWWRGDGVFVSEAVAISAEKAEPLLTSIPFAFAIVFALILVMIPTMSAVIALFRTLLGIRSDSLYSAVWKLRTPRTWKRGHTAPVTYRMKRQYGLLTAVMKPWAVTLQDEDVTEALLKAPLHTGNTLLGADCDTVADRALVHSVRYQHWQVTVLKQVAIMPFMVLVTLSLFRMHRKMDSKTYEVFTELVDAATVVVLQELAMGLKSFIWKLRGTASDRKYDGDSDLLVYKKTDGDATT